MNVVRDLFEVVVAFECRDSLHAAARTTKHSRGTIRRYFRMYEEIQAWWVKCGPKDRAPLIEEIVRAMEPSKPILHVEAERRMRMEAGLGRPR